MWEISNRFLKQKITFQRIKFHWECIRKSHFKDYIKALTNYKCIAYIPAISYQHLHVFSSAKKSNYLCVTNLSAYLRSLILLLKFPYTIKKQFFDVIKFLFEISSLLHVWKRSCKRLYSNIQQQFRRTYFLIVCLKRELSTLYF